MLNLDTKTLCNRVIKYVLEVLVVAFAASILPKAKPNFRGRRVGAGAVTVGGVASGRPATVDSVLTALGGVAQPAKASRHTPNQRLEPESLVREKACMTRV